VYHLVGDSDSAFLSPIGQLEPLTGGAAGHLNDADYWYFRNL